MKALRFSVCLLLNEVKTAHSLCCLCEQLVMQSSGATTCSFLDFTPMRISCQSVSQCNGELSNARLSERLLPHYYGTPK